MHEETVRIVDAQMKDMGKQMGALDDFVAKARSQNGRFHEAHLDSLNNMAANVRQSYSTVHEELEGFGDRVYQLQNDTAQHKDSLLESAVPLTDEVRKPLSELRANIQARPLKEYVATGVTPQKRRYEYPTTLPETEPHEALVARLRNSKQLKDLPFGGEDKVTPLNSSSPTASPSKGFVYNDAEDEVGTEPPAPTTTTLSNTGLREVDANVVARLPASSSADEDAFGRSSSVKPDSSEGDVHPEASKESSDEPPFKRHCSTAAVAESKLPHKPLFRKMAESRENVALSPATRASRASRRLRGRPSTTA